MSSIIKVDSVQDQSGNNIINENSNTITIGASGDTVNVVGTLQNNGAAIPGDISSVVAGTGLSGGGTSGAVTVNIEAAQPTVTSTGTLTSFRSTGIDDNSNALAMTIDSSENIGIGTASPVSLGSNITTLEITGGSTVRTGAVYLSSSDKNIKGYWYGSNTGYSFGTQTASDLKFVTTNTERVRIHSDGVMSAVNGVALGVGTANTASNVLDDYEEGTWEATIACGSGTVTLASSGNLCTYTKIGRTVQLNGSVTVSAISSPSGDLLINGMPFASGNNREGGERATGAFCLYNPANGTPPGLICQIFGGYASIRIESSGGADRSQADHVQVGSELRFTTNYQI